MEYKITTYNITWKLLCACVRGGAREREIPNSKNWSWFW